MENNLKNIPYNILVRYAIEKGIDVNSTSRKYLISKIIRIESGIIYNIPTEQLPPDVKFTYISPKFRTEKIENVDLIMNSYFKNALSNSIFLLNVYDLQFLQTLYQYNNEYNLIRSNYIDILSYKMVNDNDSLVSDRTLNYHYIFFDTMTPINIQNKLNSIPEVIVRIIYSKIFGLDFKESLYSMIIDISKYKFIPQLYEKDDWMTIKGSEFLQKLQPNLSLIFNEKYISKEEKVFYAYMDSVSIPLTDIPDSIDEIVISNVMEPFMVPK
jgi:hypothetical protein